jgi:dTMP kinase
MYPWQEDAWTRLQAMRVRLPHAILFYGPAGIGKADFIEAFAQALLMFASRREHVAQVIAPAHARGEWVLSDRFTDASFAYQGGGRGLDRAKLDALEEWVHPHLQPDLTLLFDVPLDVARARLAATRTLDKFEMEQADFFARVRAEYLRRAAQSGGRIVVIDSTQSIAGVRMALQAALEPWL